MSQDLSLIKLDELFCGYQLHEEANLMPKEKGLALPAKKKQERNNENESSSKFEHEN